MPFLIAVRPVANGSNDGMLSTSDQGTPVGEGKAGMAAAAHKPVSEETLSGRNDQQAIPHTAPSAHVPIPDRAAASIGGTVSTVVRVECLQLGSVTATL